jgi:deoxyadenosine/deoxycytidine kinase
MIIINIEIIMANFKIISIDGNIGSGKSLLLENLRKHYVDNKNIVFLKEPVDEWSKIVDESGITLLEKFYSDKKEYSFPFQMMAYISRLDILKDSIKKNPDAIFITERSLFTDRCVFAKMLYDSGDMKSMFYSIYLRWFDSFSSEYPINKIIYVNTKPEICNERIIKRNRTGESNIPLEYLKNCDKYHNEMLDLSRDTCVCKDQITLNGNIDIYKNGEKLEEWIQNIDKFIHV